MSQFLSPKGGKILISAILAILVVARAFASADTIPPKNTDRKRLCFTLTATAAAWGGGMLLLNEAWYKNYPRSSFHFYNDMGQWYDMDKTGHLFSSYTLSLAGMHLMRRTGMESQKAAWIGGLYGPVFLSTIEILDGFSEEWGFSVPDMAFNIAGSAIAVSQELLFGRQVARIKYSYRESGLAHYRPDALGSNLPGRMLKDYNGQTHWLSVSPGRFPGEGTPIPPWLGIAIGYSAHGLLGGSSNPSEFDGRELPHYERYRRFIISPDLDLSEIETGSEIINRALRLLNFLKVPAPAVEFNRVDGIRFHILFF